MAKDLGMMLEKAILSKCTECGSSTRYIGKNKWVCQNCGNERLDDFGYVDKFLQSNTSVAVEEEKITNGVVKKHSQATMHYLKKGR